MRSLALVFIVALSPAVAHAQRRDTLARDVVPREMQQAVEARWNANTALRSWDSVSITNGPQPLAGNVAVQNGPVVISGRVAGNVLAVNSDVILLPGARIDGDLWVIGGRLQGKEYGTIGGELRVYERRVNARRDGDRMFIDADREIPSRYPRRRPPRLGDRSWSDPIHIASAGAYNRVEGLPINIGPSIYQATSFGSVRIDAFAVVRTGSTFESSGGDVGHDVQAEVRFGRRTGPAIGGRLFNTMEPVESWQLSEIETSLSAFLFRRDYRDYYANRGVSGFGRLYLGRDASLTGTLSDERWDSRGQLNPFTLFRADASWRPNPTMDAGRMHVGNVTLKYDTRTDPDEPRSGFYVVIDGERGSGRLTSVASTSGPARAYAAGDAISYNRGFIDARSYNRISPAGQISFRFVGGGWLSGDALPMQRRLSVEGPSALPGYDFRDYTGTFDMGTCSVGTPIGRPAECDRIALAQVEYRGTLHIDVGDWREDAGRYIGARSDASWVMFFDAGRGWMVGPQSGDTTYPQGEFPPTITFRSDVGLGLDFGGIGVYAAKAISTSSEPVNFFLRLHRRF